jgi:hypothetical protein
MAAAKLTAVTVETLSGSTYVFPDMPRDMLDTLKRAGWSERLVFVNVSGAVLTMESRIVRKISYDEEVICRSPA